MRRRVVGGMIVLRTLQNVIGRAAVICGHLMLIALAIGVPLAFTMWMADAGRILVLGVIVLLVALLLVVGGDRMRTTIREQRMRRRALASTRRYSSVRMSTVSPIRRKSRNGAQAATIGG